MAFVVCAASHANAAEPLDVATLDAAEKLWTHASLQNYNFTFQYDEFISPCESWAFDVRISHGVPEHRSDCRQYRTEFSSVPALFKYLRRALKRDHYLIEAEFDPTLGYPIKAFVAWSQAADNFFSFKVVNFVSTHQRPR
jgi:hypothetical protein